MAMYMKSRMASMRMARGHTEHELPGWMIMRRMIPNMMMMMLKIVSMIAVLRLSMANVVTAMVEMTTVVMPMMSSMPSTDGGGFDGSDGDDDLNVHRVGAMVVAITNRMIVEKSMMI